MLHGFTKSIKNGVTKKVLTQIFFIQPVNYFINQNFGFLSFLFYDLKILIEFQSFKQNFPALISHWHTDCTIVNKCAQENLQSTSAEVIRPSPK